MVPPEWMIEELERMRRQREEDARPRLYVELPVAPDREPARDRDEAPRGPIVIEL
jgi:hypothetical protein